MNQLSMYSSFLIRGIDILFNFVCISSSYKYAKQCREKDGNGRLTCRNGSIVTSWPRPLKYRIYIQFGSTIVHLDLSKELCISILGLSIDELAHVGVN